MRDGLALSPELAWYFKYNSTDRNDIASLCPFGTKTIN
jgi:hypothetical protein